jgi:hypothetical protein
VLEFLNNEASHNTFPSLVVKIKELMGNLDKDTVAKASHGFHTKIETIVEINGDFFNKMLDDNIAFIFFKSNKSDLF